MGVEGAVYRLAEGLAAKVFHVEERRVLVSAVPGMAFQVVHADLPKRTPITELVRLGKIRRRIAHNYREATHCLGLGELT